MLARHRMATAAVAGAGVFGGALYYGLSWDIKEGEPQVKLESEYDETAETAAPEATKAPGQSLPAATLWKSEPGPSNNQKGI
ncbi:chitin synthase activator [Purpureocillium lavendulum]|uniref:Chitin synthase activator n=1 Tax=Purpureocillium lavendulum TaxID=1247861 RepID=A0AB34FZE5_9HYPO|nr:chitin synthase activator [Purpureocillium lavendulum]